ncbi:methylamine utilization protein [Rehaibacterium terrae]|jgi:plastocyanin|uniref:Plastocyanin n=1 Tax=Rehaibacterium terrae TaxID=1341696 RepID=A0A7W7V971_9GAMM|nr:plastocyanin [Rehaibacterium terrae]
MATRLRAALLAGLLVLAALPAAAVEVRVLSEGRPVANAVVTLSPVGRAATVTPMEAVMDQVNSEFEPRVLVVTKGSRVHFPNRDRIRHQVYSFSPAKRFELPLYTGTPPEPVLFDRTGVVTLGCNIHDWMKGYIVVVDTPHFALSDAEGRVRLEAPPGEYLLTAWHERLPSIDAAPKRRLTLPVAAAEVLELPLAPPPPPRGDERLRALQERLRTPSRP